MAQGAVEDINVAARVDAMAATKDELVEKMEIMYWTAAKREVCNMILFFHEMQRVESTYAIQTTLPECGNFERMFKVWSE